MWTRDDAFKILPRIEELAEPCGLHVAVGGSVMYRGRSSKDLDIFVYRHKTSEPVDWNAFVAMLKRELQMRWFQERDHSHYGDDKKVIVTYMGQQRIDFFLLF